MSVHMMRSTNVEQSTSVANGLQKALAEIKIETAKAQTFHWNVTGMAFGPLHELFQKIYEDHFEAEDTLAERLKALGHFADGRLVESLAKSELNESDGRISAPKMLAELAEDQRHLSRVLQDLAEIAERDGDQVTADIAIGRAEIHDKFAWMLSAHLAE